ncbi:hypothetical protein JCM10213_006681 [Rhodosporidiobolus nylandii]
MSSLRLHPSLAPSTLRTLTDTLSTPQELILDCLPSQRDLLTPSTPATPPDLDLDPLFLPFPLDPLYEPALEHHEKGTMYSHYQPPPQPLQPFSYPQQQQQQPMSNFPQSQQPPPLPFGQQQMAGKGVPPFSSMGYTAQGAGAMGVGAPGGGDFELFGPSPSPQGGQQQALYPPGFGYLQQQPRVPYGQQQQNPYSPASTRSSFSSLTGGADYTPLPDLVHSPASTVSHSPPSPRFASLSSYPSFPSLSLSVPFPPPPAGPPSSRPQLGQKPSFTSQGITAAELAAGIERPNSTPLPDPPRGPVRRKTQERSAWPSFYSSSGSSTSSSSSGAGYMPTAPAAAYTAEPASYSTPSSDFTPASAALALSPYDNSAAPFASPLPHTDHPLLPSEQSDLLDRVRRDLALLEADFDLSSIKGPLRALALGGGGGAGETTAGERTPQPATAAGGVRPSPAMSALSAEDALSAGTVSPQEAFLDYDAVDSRVHGTGEFGVGVGVAPGGSLFAPLPASVPHPPTSTYPHHHLPPHAASSPIRSSTPRARAVAGSPTPQPAPPPGGHGARRPHPFSVPQNAVTWASQRTRSGQHWAGGIVDGDADDEDGDFVAGAEGEPSTGDEQEEERKREAVRGMARLGEGFGRFTKEDVDLRGGEGPGMSEEEKERYGLVEPQVKREEEDEEEEKIDFASLPEDFAELGRTPKGEVPPFSVAPAAAAPTPQPQQPPQQLAYPPPPALLPALPAIPSSQPQSTTLNGAPYPPPPALAPAPAPPAASDATPTRPQRQRKRSRRTFGSDGEDGEGEEEEEYRPPPSIARSTASASADDAGAAGDSDDASYHSSHSAAAPSRRSGPSAGPAPKRRRRAPNASASAAAGPNAIRCDHVNEDGTQCGVAFRRPYDLARHKESIHSEGMNGEKLAAGKAKEFKCQECGGVFSRRDALLRHSRIKGHNIGA